jgi:glycerol kinase
MVPIPFFLNNTQKKKKKINTMGISGSIEATYSIDPQTGKTILNKLEPNNQNTREACGCWDQIEELEKDGLAFTVNTTAILFEQDYHPKKKKKNL